MLRVMCIIVVVVISAITTLAVAIRTSPAIRYRHGWRTHAHTLFSVAVDTQWLTERCAAHQPSPRRLSRCQHRQSQQLKRYSCCSCSIMPQALGAHAKESLQQKRWPTRDFLASTRHCRKGILSGTLKPTTTSSPSRAGAAATTTMMTHQSPTARATTLRAPHD